MNISWYTHIQKLLTLTWMLRLDGNEKPKCFIMIMVVCVFAMCFEKDRDCQYLNVLGVIQSWLFSHGWLYHKCRLSYIYRRKTPIRMDFVFALVFICFPTLFLRCFSPWLILTFWYSVICKPCAITPPRSRRLNMALRVVFDTS